MGGKGLSVSERKGKGVYCVVVEASRWDKRGLTCEVVHDACDVFHACREPHGKVVHYARR